MANELSKIKLPSGTEYTLKDSQARQDIASLQNAMTGKVALIGPTTTALADQATTNPIKINNVDVTAVAGNLVYYNKKEFLFDGTKWVELGDLSSLGSLAYKNNASGKVTPTGTVSSTFTGASSNVTITTADNTSGNYQPKGTVTVSTNTTTNKTATVSATSGTATYTPAGTINTPVFTGTTTTINSTGKFTPSGSVGLTNTNKTATVSAATSGEVTYTPEGTVAAPAISVKTAGSTTSINNPTSTTCAKTVVAAAPGATAPANNITYYSVSGETLSLYQLGYTTGASISVTSTTVKTGDAAYQATAPAFTGTGKRLVTSSIPVPTSASFTGTEGNLAVAASYTPAGTNDDLTFTGTGVHLTTGNIPVPSTYTATFTGTKAQISGTTTANGSVSSSFTGDEKTVTVS